MARILALGSDRILRGDDQEWSHPNDGALPDRCRALAIVEKGGRMRLRREMVI